MGADFVDVIRTTLSPALSERGFGPGGPGRLADGGVSFLYCTGAREFAASWPATLAALKMAGHVGEDEPGRCLDFVVEASSEGHISRLDLEFVDVSQLLAAMGFDEVSDRCSADVIRASDPAEAARTIAAAVSALLPLHGAD